jgi:cell surface protein SprA
LELKKNVNQSKTRGNDPENFYFSQSFNQVERHDFEIEDYVDQQHANSAVDYAYTFKPKPVEPLKSKF